MREIRSVVEMRIEEVKKQNVTFRVSPHSHIKNLGILPDGNINPNSTSIIGQEDARLACGIIFQMINTKKMAGRAILLAGPPGTGKTALASAIASELGPRVPFVPMVAGEIFSVEVKKTEVMMEYLRRSIGIRVKEVKEVYEGEVCELSPCEIKNPVGGYAKTISHVLIGLKTTKGTKQLKLDPTIYEHLIKENVQLGDVIYIEANGGSVKRLGRCDNYASEYDLEAEEYVPMPKGDVYKKKDIVQDLTLHDLDVANANPKGGQDAFSLVNQMMKSKKTEITEKLRNQVNKMVNQFLDQGIAEFVPGVLFIDEVHMLDLESFAFLQKALESDMAPIVVLATNRGMSKIRGSDIVSPHGIPLDFMNRITVVNTVPYSKEELSKIINLRANAEDIELAQDVLEHLTAIASSVSLRYALRLLSPSKVISNLIEKNSTLSISAIEEAKRLFVDYRFSSQQKC